jgi:DNA-binding CsgD family transcriptional regulator
MSSLLDRDRELSHLRSALEDAEAGRGGLLVVEGEAGIGKSALLAALAQQAAGRDFVVLRSRAGPLERDAAYGVARVLFTPLLEHADAARRERLLAGAAALCTPLFAPVESSEQRSSFATRHGLYWLLANASELAPVLLVLDDVQWADDASLEWFLHLVRGIDALRVLAVVALRPGEPAASTRLLDALCAERAVVTLAPSPLSEGAAAQLLEAIFNRPPDVEFTRACHASSGGNPFLLIELARALRADSATPDNTHATAVDRAGPPAVARDVAVRLRRLGEEASRLATAVAVLESDARLDVAAELADLSIEQAERALDLLVGAHLIVAGEPVVFAHPVLRAAVYDGLPPGQRSAAHRQAARMLAARQAAADRVAAQLIATEPAADPWAVEQLRAAAWQAMSAGAPAAAAAVLERALAEPPEADDRAAVLLELAAAVRALDMPRSIEHLKAALTDAHDDELRERTGMELANVLLANPGVGNALATLQDLVARFEHHAPQRAARLAPELAAISALFHSQVGTAALDIGQPVTKAPHGRARAVMMAAQATDLFRRTAATAADAAELAERALESGTIPDDTAAFFLACSVLIWTDRFSAARLALDAAIERSHARGTPDSFGAAMAFRALLEYEQGNLDASLADALTALDAIELVGFGLMVPSAVARIVEARVERDELDACDELLQSRGLDGAVERTSAGTQLLVARSRLRFAQGRPAEALADGVEALARRSIAGPAPPVGWRAVPALASLRCGQDADAARLADEELELAGRWGLPSAVGRALAVRSALSTREKSIDDLERASGILAGTQRQLDHARSLVDLGAARRRANQRIAARAPLAEGMDLAHRCGTTALVTRARQELLATGARPRKLVLTGADSLTPSELRVAQMAATGMSNPDIAQALFITRKTVEKHMSNTLMKLGIAARDQIATALER